MSGLVTKIYYSLPSFLKNILITGYAWKNHNKRRAGVYQNKLNLYRESYHWTRPQLKNYQLEELTKLLREASLHSDFYKDRVSTHFVDELNQTNIQNQLKKLPFLSKDELKNKVDSIQNKSRKSDHINMTSGTTGTPTKVYYDDESTQISFALWRRFHDVIGLPESYRSVRFSGRIICSPTSTRPPFWVYNYLDKQLLMSTYHLNDRNMKSYVDKLNHFKPLFLDGYPSALYILANFIVKNSLKLTFRPKAIATTAETLYEHQRVVIESAFGCKVYNQYASSEGGSFVTECSQGNLHLNLDSGIFEFYTHDDKIAESGDMAELIVTSFRNLKTPLIRYKTGDFFRLSEDKNEQCECGSWMPMVEEIIGRQDDILYTEEKGYVGRMDPAYKGLEGIVKSKIVQESIDRINVFQIVDQGYTEYMNKKFLRSLKDRLGEKVNIEIKIVDEIPLSKNGKFKAVERNFEIKE